MHVEGEWQAAGGGDAVASLVDAALRWSGSRAYGSILVAASGGLDSTVLLDVLHRSRSLSAEPFRLGAAYLDHGWRGAEAGADARLVARMCEARGIPFYEGSVAEAMFAGRRRLSPEAAARDARYAFLAEVARREGYAAVASAHHAGDQAETLLLKLQRGCSLEDVSLTRPAVRLHGIHVVRPLLEVPPEVLLRYAEDRGLPFREDATNADLRFPRNRLRHLAVAHIDELDLDALVRLAAVRRRLVEAVAGHCHRLIATSDRPERRTAPWPHAATGATAVTIPVAALADLPFAIRRELLRRAVRRAGGHSTGLPERALGQLEHLLASPRGGAVTLRGARARVSCGQLIIEASYGRAGKPPAAAARDRGPSPPEVEFTTELTAAAVEGVLEVRPWQPGDRIELRTGRKKVKEVLREARVPAWERERYPVVTDARGVLWVVGLSRRWGAVPGSKAPTLRLRVTVDAERGRFRSSMERL